MLLLKTTVLLIVFSCRHNGMIVIGGLYTVESVVSIVVHVTAKRLDECYTALIKRCYN